MGNVYIIKHARTAYNARRVFQGNGLDIPLDDFGRLQAERLADLFEGLSLEYIITSTARRAYETGEPLADRKGLPLIKLPEIIERDHGRLNESQYQGAEHVVSFLMSNGNAEGGEPFEAVRDRAKHFLDYLRDMHADSDLLVVTHGTFMNVLLNELEGEETRFNPEYHLKFGELHHYELQNGVFVNRKLKASILLEAV